MTTTNLRPLIAIAVALAFTLTSPTANAQPPAAAVVVAKLIQRDVAAGQTFVGTVVPSQTAVIGSAVAGRVVDFSVEEGQRVAAKSPLAKLLTATIELQLKAAEAELELRHHELRELEAGSRPEEKAQARAEMEIMRAERDYTNERRQRLVGLKAKGAVSIEEQQRSLADANAAAARYAKAEAALALVEAGPREERISQAKAQLAVQQAIVDELKDKIKKYTIVTRFDGYVTAEHTEVGEWLQVGSPVAEIAALDEVDVIAQVVESQVRFVKQGMTVRVELPSQPDLVLTGVVDRIVPKGDLRSRTFPVKIRMQNEIRGDEPLVKAGMYARVVLPTGSSRLALLTSKDAIVLGGPLPQVYAVRKTKGGVDEAVPVDVQLGVAVGSLIQVTGALKATDRIVIEGNERIRPGQPLSATETDLDPDPHASDKPVK